MPFFKKIERARNKAAFMRWAESSPADLVELMTELAARPDLTDRWQVHIRKHHYSEPYPDFAAISAEDTYRRAALAIDFDAAQQLDRMRTLAAAYGGEVKALAGAKGADNEIRNTWFSGLDAALYYAILRDLRPRRVIEVGGGYSTRIAARALAANRTAGVDASLICIEPYPQRRLLAGGIAMTLIESRVESLPLSTFAELSAGDVLFIDSSHVARFGGDVNYLILEVLPMLAPGVWVEFHDIFLPTDYPPRWLIERRLAFTEQYLLAAFLAFNSCYRTEFGVRWLLLDHGPELRSMWPAEVPLEGGSLASSSYWIRRLG